VNQAALPVGILLAAGRGRRFDPVGEKKKLLQVLPATGEVVLAASVRHLKQVLDRVIGVVRPGDEDIAAVLHAAGCEVVVCAAADDGMAQSLGAALTASLPPAQCYTPSVTSSWIVALGDMPWVAPATIAALAGALADGAAIAAPVFDGRRGNPVGFSAAMLPELLNLRGDEGARSLFQRHPFTAVATDDSGVLRDVDLPSDL
jgi:molybdenum cofactor cytidylyltransferase